MVMPARSSGSALSSWKRVNRRDFENNENGKFSSSGYTSVSDGSIARVSIDTILNPCR